MPSRFLQGQRLHGWRAHRQLREFLADYRRSPRQEKKL